MQGNSKTNRKLCHFFSEKTSTSVRELTFHSTMESGMFIKGKSLTRIILRRIELFYSFIVTARIKKVFDFSSSLKSTIFAAC